MSLRVALVGVALALSLDTVAGCSPASSGAGSGAGSPGQDQGGTALTVGGRVGSGGAVGFGGSAGVGGSATVSSPGGDTGGSAGGGATGTGGTANIGGMTSMAGSGGAPFNHVPGRAVTPFGYGEVYQVLASSNAAGMDGASWCTNDVGKNQGGAWACQSVSGGHSCGAQVPVGELVSCVRAAAPASVDEAPFAPVACDSDRLDGAAKAFCAGTEYMQTRVQATLYQYNDWLRVGLNRSFGGTLTELYGADKRNRIEEHGGSAIQLSVWAYDANSGPAGFFTNQSCNPTPFSDANACKAANAGRDCRLFGTGQHVVDCQAEQACLDWSAAGPWNPIQAQAANCGWNGPTNDVDSVVPVTNGVKLSKQNPYHFTKTGQMMGLLWSTAGRVRPDRPYVELDYEMDYSGPFALSEHNQEIPALFTDTRLGSYFYYYGGSEPYANAASAVQRVAGANLTNTQLRLPGRTGEMPQPPAAYLDATEAWLSSCDASESQCVTLVSFAADVKVFSIGGQYLSPLGRFSFAGHHAWTFYLFPYRYDDVVAGRTVREWVYELHANGG